jgi:hypothetical protein
MAEAKIRGPLIWVILGVVTLVVIIGAVLTSIGYFATQGTSQTISTVDPAFGALKLMTLSNRDLEVVREEPENMQLLVHNKKTNEYFISRADDATKTIMTIPVPADQVK